MVSIGTKVRDLRKSSKMTQLELANRIGITKSAISAIETDMRSPSLDVLIKLSRIFKVSTDYLLGMEKGYNIDVSGLNESQIQIIYSMINELKKSVHK